MSTYINNSFRLGIAPGLGTFISHLNDVHEMTDFMTEK